MSDGFAHNDQGLRTTEYLSLESCEGVEMMMLSQNDLQKSGRRLRQLS